jgi:hypothetical protein
MSGYLPDSISAPITVLGTVHGIHLSASMALEDNVSPFLEISVLGAIVQPSLNIVSPIFILELQLTSIKLMEARKSKRTVFFMMILYTACLVITQEISNWAILIVFLI